MISIIYVLMFSIVLILYIISTFAYRIKHKKFLNQILDTLREDKFHLEKSLEKNIKLWEKFATLLERRDNKNNDYISVPNDSITTTKNLVHQIFESDPLPHNIFVSLKTSFYSTIEAKYEDKEVEYKIIGSSVSQKEYKKSLSTNINCITLSTC